MFKADRSHKHGCVAWVGIMYAGCAGALLHEGLRIDQVGDYSICSNITRRKNDNNKVGRETNNRKRKKEWTIGFGEEAYTEASKVW